MVKNYPTEREEKVLELVKKYPLYSLDKLAANLPGVSRHSIQNILEKNNLSTIEKRLAFGNQEEETKKENSGVEMVEEIKEEIAVVNRSKPIKNIFLKLKSKIRKPSIIEKKVFGEGTTRKLLIGLPIILLILFGGSYLVAKAPVISLEKPSFDEEIRGSKLIVAGKVKPASSQLKVNGNKVLVSGDGSFTTIIEIPQGESILTVDAENKFKRAQTVRLVKRSLTQEEINEQKQTEDLKKKERSNQVAQIDRQVNDLLAAKNAATNQIAGGMVKVTNSQLKEEAGFTTVFGEVLNMGQKEVAWVMIVAKFFSTNGTMVDSKIGFATGFDETIKSGDTATFETQATTQNFDRYSLEVTWQEGSVAGAATASGQLTPTPSRSLGASPTPKPTMTP